MSFEEFQNRSRLYVIGALEPDELEEFEAARKEFGQKGEDFPPFLSRLVGCLCRFGAAKREQCSWQAAGRGAGLRPREARASPRLSKPELVLGSELDSIVEGRRVGGS